MISSSCDDGTIVSLDEWKSTWDRGKNVDVRSCCSFQHDSVRFFIAISGEVSSLSQRCLMLDEADWETTVSGGHLQNQATSSFSHKSIIKQILTIQSARSF